MDGNRAGVAGHADTSRGIAVEEDLAGSTLNHGSDPERFLVGLVAFGRCLPFVASLPGEISGRAQQRAQVVDRALGLAEVLPGDGNHIGKQLLVLACFAHEFEDQEFMKSQVAKALEVAGGAGPKLTWQGRYKGLYLFCLLHVSTDMNCARHHERAFFRLKWARKQD